MPPPNRRQLKPARVTSRSYSGSLAAVPERANMCSTRRVPAVQPQRYAMARALERAATRFEDEALRLDALRERRRKPHPGDDTAAVSRTLHNVARQLRSWARLCLDQPEGAGDRIAGEGLR